MILSLRSKVITLALLLTLALGSDSTYIFSASEKIKSFATLYGFELKSNYLYTSATNYAYLEKYDGSTLETMWKGYTYTSSHDMEMDLMKNWFFTIPHRSSVYPIYFFSYGDTTQTNITFSSTKGRYLWNLDLSGDYLLSNAQQRNTLFEYINGQFEEISAWQSMNQTYGAEICEDKMVIAHEYNGSYSLFKVYTPPTSQSEQYTQSQSFELTSDARFILTATDDCKIVILTTYQLTTITIFTFFRSTYGAFSLQSEKVYQEEDISNKIAYDACLSPGGNLFAIAAYSGVSVWIYDPLQNEFVYSKNIDTARRDECTINHNTIMSSDTGGGMYKVDYSPEDPKAIQDLTYDHDYYKTSLQFTLKNTLTDASSEIVDIHAEGDHLFYFEKYGKAYVNDKQDDGTYDLNKTVDENHFFQKTVSNSKYKLLVQSSLDNNIYVYQDAGTDKSYESVFNLTTASRVLDIDINAEGVLLVGFENGEIIEYTWDNVEGQFTESQKQTDEFARVQEVKMCSDGTKLAIVRKFEKFYFQFYTTYGLELQNQTLDELIDVELIATEDCSKAFIASQMERKVEIFTRVYDRYALIKSIAEDLPVTNLAINPDGDVLTITRLFGKKVTIYSLNCNGEYVREKDFSEISACQITNQELILADRSGRVSVYGYTFLAATCGYSGFKEVEGINTVNTVVDASRTITSVEVSGSQMLASSKYSGLFLFEKGAEGFNLSKHLGGNIFISDVDIVSSLDTFVAASHNRSVLVYKDEGEGYSLTQTIQTKSQPLHVDLSHNKKVLVGMMNGDLALLSPGFQDSINVGDNITHEGQGIFGVALCSDDSKIALIEREGLFRMVVYSPENAELASFTVELEEEYIEPYLAASSECDIVAISGVSMGKVKVFREGETGLMLFKTIDAGEPLGEVSFEEDGDLLVVPSIINQKSFVYHFTECQQEYQKIQELASPSYDEVTSMSEKYIVQGGENGKIKVSQYSWSVDNECVIGASATHLNGIRRKQGDRNNVQSGQETQSQNVKEKTDQSLRSENSGIFIDQQETDGLSSGGIAAIVLSSLVISSVVIFLVFWKLKNKKQEKQESDKSQSAQDMHK